MRQLTGQMTIRAVLIVFLFTGSAQAATYYFHNDQLGTPQVVTDQNQTVVWQGEYDPFGEATETVAEVEQNLRFPGQYLDRETGLHYNYFRTYDPGIGRYTQSDPIGLVGGISTYGYAYQNPNIYTDPTGELVPAVWWGVTALWAAFEVAGSAYDLYDTVNTFADECSSTTDKVVAGGLYAAGIFLPGAGYSKIDDVAKRAGKADNVPDFVVSPGGTAFPVPRGATGGPTPVMNPAGKRTGDAFTGGSGGANGQVDTMRMMDPTPPRGKSPGYPNGYIKFENRAGQGVDPYTGRTLSNKDSHFPID